jgi:hypothetical protein
MIQEIHDRCSALGATCGEEAEVETKRRDAAQTKAAINLLELEASVIAA